MAPAVKNQSNVVQIKWLDKEAIVTVTPSNEDRFSIKMRKAAEILQLGNRQEDFSQQFKVLLDVIVSWLKPRSDIAGAYITHRDGVLACVVVRRTAEYDAEFEDALSQLNMDVANDSDLPLVRVRMISLPAVSEETLCSFLDPAFSLVLLPLWQET